MLFHPDRQVKRTKMHSGNTTNAEISLDEYQRISVAYSVLIDPERRQAYDERRTLSQTYFDRIRDEIQELRYRIIRRISSEDITSDEATKEEEERERREKDPNAFQIIFGSRKLRTYCLVIAGIYFVFWLQDRIIQGNILRSK